MRKFTYYFNCNHIFPPYTPNAAHEFAAATSAKERR
jgi:hypothetical protein